jgi:hypothetical protein
MMSRPFFRIPIAVAILLLAVQQVWAAAPKQPATTEKPVAKIDLNRATSEQLQELPGIGKAYSKKIMAGRPYKSVRDLSKIGIPAPTIKKITPLVVVNTPKKPPKIAYLRKHGEAGRLQYPTFRKLGIPLGSGAIESGIRRVINLRLKNNGMFWREEHAEEMLQVRAQVISKRWDERVKAMRHWDHTEIDVFHARRVVNQVDANQIPPRIYPTAMRASPFCIFSYNSWRCTGVSRDASMPSSTLSPRIRSTVTTTLSLITMLSFGFRLKTNMVRSFCL